MHITNGTVEFTTPRPFEAKSARVSLTFMVGDGEDPEAIAAQVGEIAKRRALSMIGEAPPVVVEPSKRRRAPDPAIIDQQSEVPSSPLPSSDPAAIIMDDTPPQAPTEAKPVSDRDIADHCARATSRGVNPLDIRRLVGEWTQPSGGKAKDIPADSRPAFLAALDAMKAV